MSIEIPMSERSKKYGYVFWGKRADSQIESLLKEKQKISVKFNGVDLGEKNIDWKHRRISLGWTQTRSLPNKKASFFLTVSKDNWLNIKTV